MKINLKISLIFCAFLFSTIHASAQITHSGKGIICIGDLSYFSYQPKAGKTVSTYQWSFGDSYTSTDAAPYHLYKSTGLFTVKLNTSLVGGGSTSETFDVEVLSLPKADFTLDPNSTLCQFDKLVLHDKSTPADASRKITERNILWGNGIRANAKGNIPSTVTHTYQSWDKFTIELEIIDSKGCKSVTTKAVTIKSGIQADWEIDLDNTKCSEVTVCLKNSSRLKSGTSASYQWEFDGNNSLKPHFSSGLCNTYSRSKIVFAKLIATTSEGCASVKQETININVDLRNHVLQSTDSVVCYGQKEIRFYADKRSDEKIYWFVNGDVAKDKDTLSNFVLRFKSFKLDTGTHEVKCQIIRGRCVTTLTQSIRIIGPIADGTIFNGRQCGPSRKVFFVADLEKGYNPKWEYEWKTVDANGENCVIDRANNINKYRNCNTTKGWFGKHRYSEKQAYYVSLTVTDNEIGCSDKQVHYVSMNACGNCDPSLNPLFVCQGAWFMSPEREQNDPVKFSFDGGKKWMKYPSKLPNYYVGWQDLSLIYQWKPKSWVEDYGDDSIRIHVWPVTISDTLTFTKAVFIEKSKQDSVSLEFGKGCQPVDMTVKLKNGDFKAGESISIDWGDSTTFYQKFGSGQVKKEYSHQFKAQGANDTIIVVLTSAQGCTTQYKLPYKFGYKVRIRPLTPICVGSDVCFEAEIRDFATDEEWHPDGWDGVASWYRNDSLISDKKFIACTQFNSVGKHTITMIAKSARGCKDTTDYIVNVSKVRAGVKKQSLLHYCKGQREFLDSSKTLYSKDQIAGYSWDFGSGNFSSLVKNPVFSFDGSKSIITIRHAVRTYGGCKDTISFDIRILKSKPSLFIGDSIGCAPFNAKLKNTSKGASHFIWEMGDVRNTTVQKTDTGEVQFTYTKPGRYFVHLIGIDSFYNRINGLTYYCHTSYPDPTQKPFSILVLPSKHSGIAGPDTLCVDELAAYKSLGTNDLDSEFWTLESGKRDSREPGWQHMVAFSSPGDYTLRLEPVFMSYNLVPRCISEITKKIHVDEVKADFDIDPSSTKPVYQFINKSDPSQLSYAWNFDDPNSGSLNQSSLKDPKHNFKRRNRTFQVCLISTLRPGCADRVCKPLHNDYTQFTELFNVFTPGDADNFNEDYVVLLEGEAFHEFTIYNRWGENVFESANKSGQSGNISWNGKVGNDGAECPEGTYFYVLKYSYTDEPDEMINASGTITLIRD
jgi:PKD repeat protein